MALAVRGGEIYHKQDLLDSQKPAGDDTASHNLLHREAVAEARKRAKIITGEAPDSVALKFTARLVIAVDFDDAKSYREKVDAQKIRLKEIETAAKTSGGEARIEALMRATPEELASMRSRTVRAKAVDRDFDHGGEPFPAGHFVLLWPDSRVTVASPAELKAGFELVKKPTKPKE